MAEVILKAEKPLAVYNEFRQQLSQLKATNDAIVFDYADPASNKEARSHIYKLRLTKGAVEKARKAAKQASLEYGRLVDSEAKEIVAEIESMIDVHEKPIKELEEREAERVQKHRDHIQRMREVAAQIEHPDGTPLTADEYLIAVEYLEKLVIDESWEEFRVDAEKVRGESIEIARRRHAERVTYELEQAELERLRREAAELAEKERIRAEQQAAKEREEQLRCEGEERARKEAEAKAVEEMAAAERAEREAEERREQERQAAIRREQELKAQAERAEHEKLEAQKRAEQAEKDAEARAKANAEAAKRKEIEEQARREADKKHRGKINSAAMAGLVEGGIDEVTARAVIVLIAEGKVPNVSIRY